MTNPTTVRTASIALGGLALVGALAGCSNAVVGGTTGGSTDSTTDSGSNSGSAGAGSYADGDYTAEGTYQSPGGTETITVDLTLAHNTVTAVTVTGVPSGPDATHYQGQFESGIAAEVVGKSLDEVSVSRVAGSSLTSTGFNAAIDDIKSQAAA